MTDLMDLDASLSAARAAAEAWRIEFEKQFGGRYVTATARAQLTQLAKAIVNNPQMAAYYQAKMPEQFAKMQAMVGQEGKVSDGMGYEGQ